jgi:hypothetical protein
MWFGDNVTCATWSDIWINEGFASYGEYLARQNLLGQSSANGWMSSTHNNVLSQPGGSVYVPPSDLDDIWRIFNGRLSYDKGAAIIHMIRFEINNDSLFFQVLENFQTIYADSTATGDDFKEVVEDVTGDDYDYFFNQWYYGEGYPTYSIVWNQTPEGLNMNITQDVSMPSVTPFFEMDMEYRVGTTAVDTIIRLRQDANFNQFTIPIEGDVIVIIADPNNWVLNKTGSVVVGIEETENPVYFSFGPNPVKDYLNLYMNNEVQDVEIDIVDVTGRVMMDTKKSGETIKLNLSDLPQGTYLIRITDGEAAFTQRFVKI